MRTTVPRVESTKLGRAATEKKPDRVDEARRCWCGTKLSAYNRNDTCYTHAPIRFPRVRGR